ncbi:hypothetical protein SAMN05443551_3636 [Marivita hallyeonensis]|uniref:Uncharacterized protein n=1 Tax=Marivita hallyeonensis TaxID=996342 RepID=A0A1M5X025_9RHOB|nr:hypothetical protein SAMN05443551_3636 [Marivita hallyeonensis]
MDLENDFTYRAQHPITERDLIMRRVRSHRKWAQRRFWLRLRATVFGRRQVRVPANLTCQSERSSSVILRKVTSGTLKA